MQYSAFWHPLKKLLFRFAFLYFVIYCFPFPLDAFELTKPLAQPFYSLLDFLIPRIGEKWFHIRASPAFPMFDKFDDSGYGLVFLYINIIVSAVGAIFWSLFDRKRENYEQQYQWLKLYLRYFLAAYLFGYGFVKVFPSQFQPITASRLTTLVGDQSPMQLAWNFMGYSAVFLIFMGAIEVIAGLLLLLRRTTTLGAILAFFVFGFIALMDFCFNVPVKLLVLHLVIISVFLTLEDRRRLLNVFIFNRPTALTYWRPLVSHPVWRIAFLSFQAIFIISILYSSIASSIKTENEIGRRAPRIPLYGVYNTSYFIRNNDTVPPLETDSLRWKQLVIDGGSWNQSGIIQFSSGKKIVCNIQADTLIETLRLQSRIDTTEIYTFDYDRTDPNRLVLEGIWKKDSIKVGMRKYDLNNYLLHSEKFRWIEK